MRKVGLTAGVIVALAAGVYFANRHPHTSSQTQPAARKAAPEFSLPDLEGKDLQLSSLRGKVVLLDFWATWCEPCKAEIPNFVEFQSKYRGQGLVVLGVSMDDSPDPVKAFYSKYQMNYPVVIGTAKTGDEYGGILGLPIAFVLDRKGRIITRHIGATPPATFEKEIQAALKETS